MRAQHYDAVFLGARTPTLLGAAYLARNGLRVLVLGQGTLEPTYKVDGVELPRTGSLALPLGSPGVRHLLEAIAVMPSLKRRASSPPVALPIRLANKSLDLEREASLRARAVEREFPGTRRELASFEHRARLAREAFDAYLELGGTLLARGFRASRALQRFEKSAVFGGDVGAFDPLGELRREPRVVEAMQLPARFRSALASDPLGLPLALAHERALEGPVLVEGGEPWLRGVVIERIESYGGDVRPRVAADRVLTSGRAVSGVRLRTSHEEVGASAVITGVPASSLAPLLPEGSAAAATGALLAGPSPRLARYVLNVAFVAEGVPPGFDHELYFVPGRPRAGVQAVHLERGLETEGHVWISVVALAPLPLPDGATLRREVLEILREVFPFAARHLRFVDSPHDDIGLVALPSGDIVAEEGPVTRELAQPETLDEIPLTGPFGLRGLPTELPLEGLVLANSQVLPALGVEGELLAALEVARRLLERSGSARFSRLAPFRSRRW